MPDITIRLQKGTETAGDGLELQEDKGSKANNKKMAAVTLITNFAISQGKAILSASISNIGITTGDYIKQEQIQQMMGYAQDLAGIGAAFVINPLVGAFAVAGAGIKYGIQIYTDIKKAEIENVKITYMRDRSGNTTINGSRTGD